MGQAGSGRRALKWAGAVALTFCESLWVRLGKVPQRTQPFSLLGFSQGAGMGGKRKVSLREGEGSPQTGTLNRYAWEVLGLVSPGECGSLCRASRIHPVLPCSLYRLSRAVSSSVRWGLQGPPRGPGRVAWFNAWKALGTEPGTQ